VGAALAATIAAKAAPTHAEKRLPNYLSVKATTLFVIFVDDTFY